MAPSALALLYCATPTWMLVVRRLSIVLVKIIQGGKRAWYCVIRDDRRSPPLSQ